MDFRENLETIVNKGRNAEGAWLETWYDKENGLEKWAKKEGESFLT